nr:hypothetical protein [uncultured Microbacterium sp.]
MAHEDAGASTPAPTPDGGVSSTSSLPAASPVARARAAVSSWSRGRKTLAIGSVLGGAALITIGVLTTGASAGPGYNAPVTVYADSTQQSGEPADDSAEQLSVAETDEAVETKDPTDATEQDGTTPDATDPPVSDTTDPSNPGTSDPGTSNPGTSDPGTSDPGTSDPGTSGPGGTDPGTLPPPPTTQNPPPPPPTQDPPQPAPLAFAGLQKNYGIKVGPLSVLSSYTLTITGQPGAVATVTYGSTSAGSVTFDGNGRATTTFGGSLINLGLNNPTIRVAYSDGTGAIEAPRDSL